jgi:hypothetical protein
MQIQRSAFVPGEIIELKIKVNNQSSRVVKSEKVSLSQNIIYYGTQDGLTYEKRQSRTETRTIWEKKEVNPRWAKRVVRRFVDANIFPGAATRGRA